MQKQSWQSKGFTDKCSKGFTNKCLGIAKNISDQPARLDSERTGCELVQGDAIKYIMSQTNKQYKSSLGNLRGFTDNVL